MNQSNRSDALRLMIALVIVLALSSASARPINAEDREVEFFESPRIAALAKQLSEGESADHETQSEKFWLELQDKCPLIEPIDGDPHVSWITYLWHGDTNTRSVSVAGGPPSSRGDSIKWLTRLANTDIWYLTERVPNDARFVYLFHLNRPTNLPLDPERRDDFLFNLVRSDPLNPHSAGRTASIVELPNAPPQPWLEKRSGAPEGQLSDVLTLSSATLGQEREFRVLVPADYVQSKDPCRLLIMFDGSACIPVYQIILDNLAADKTIPGLVTAFVFQTAARDRELACSDKFADFVATELVPWLRDHYRVSSEPTQTIVCGASRGGLMAAYCARRHPELFGNVVSISGSYWWHPSADDPTLSPDEEPGWLIREYVKSDRMPIRFFMSAGRFENNFPMSLLEENRRFRDVLLSKGFTVDYREYSSGHNPYCWHNPFVDGLTALATRSADDSAK
jgi:enterochelin esterase family protein